jgi:hypothetical protein
VFQQRVAELGIKEVRITPHSPWQNPYVERLIGTIRRECLNHVIVLNEAHLMRILSHYFDYYHAARPHQSLDDNAPRPREVEPPKRGKVVAQPMVGGLHHRYSARGCVELLRIRFRLFHRTDPQCSGNWAIRAGFNGAPAIDSIAMKNSDSRIST